MIISRTPYRISFFGGGTDYHAWYQEHGGQVISTSINKYCYINARILPPFFEHRSRIVWSIIEMVKENYDITHPSIRETLKFLGIDEGIEIHHNGDLPARSGLGSSSTFTVGLLNALYTLNGYIANKGQLASEAIYVERELIKENVGVQDQIAAAFGGLNKITINQNGSYNVNKIELNPLKKRELKSHLMLFFTGIARTASEIAATKISSIPNKYYELSEMYKMVDIAIDILENSSDIKEFGKLLHESWLFKRSISDAISNNIIDEIYDTAMKNGAIGGKLLGAGGGGFMLIFAEPENHDNIRSSLANLIEIPFDFEDTGSTIIFSDNSSNEYIWHKKEFSHLNKTQEELLNFFKVGSYD